MITEYYRPDTISEALKLLSRADVPTIPMGGGTGINQKSPSPVAVVDLQSLSLDVIEIIGRKIKVGAMVTLQQILDFEIQSALKAAIYHETTYNIRQVATIAGALVSADGRSPFATTMLALDADLKIQPGDVETSLGNFMPLREESNPNQLITHVALSNQVELAYQYVARTPADQPIVCTAVARWPSGRTRVALGGYGSAPVLAMDGPEFDGVEPAARDSYREAGDQWASAMYRSDMAGVLVQRCIQALS